MVLACVFTVIIELAIFLIFGYRKWNEIVLVILANVATNVTLNAIVALTRPKMFVIYILEAAVVAVEYLIYAHAFNGSLKLFLLTLGANVASYCTGLLIQDILIF